MLNGIDVSKWQGNIDWKKVKNAGVDFAMIRTGYGWGKNQKDAKFEQNYANAKKVGMPLGAYHYSYATSVEDAEKEADFCYSIIKGKQISYPIAFDVEEKRISDLGKEGVSKIVKAFCNKMESYGYYVCIYANKYWLDKYFTDDIFGRYDIWLAQWTDKPTFDKAYTLWQTTSKGQVDGISTNVDLDYCLVDYPTKIISQHLNGYGEATPVKLIDEIAHEVLEGKWGNGADRKRRLEEAGYPYAMVQARVNTLLGSQKPSNSILAGDTVKVTNGSKDLNTGKKMALWAYARKYKVKSITGNRAVLTYNGTIVTAQDVKNLKKV